jgi:hypothetical protein
VTAVDLYFGMTDSPDAVVLRAVATPPGPTVFSVVLEWLHDGKAAGLWSPGYVDVSIAGQPLHSMLDWIKSTDPDASLDEQERRLETFRRELTDDSRCWMKAIAY